MFLNFIMGCKICLTHDLVSYKVDCQIVIQKPLRAVMTPQLWVRLSRDFWFQNCFSSSFSFIVIYHSSCVVRHKYLSIPWKHHDKGYISYHWPSVRRNCWPSVDSLTKGRVIRSFVYFSVVSLKKLLSKQTIRRWVDLIKMSHICTHRWCVAFLTKDIFKSRNILFCIISTLLALWVHNSPINSPYKGQWRGAFIFSLICPWTNGSVVNNRNAGDLDEIVLIMTSLQWHNNCIHSKHTNRYRSWWQWLECPATVLWISISILSLLTSKYSISYSGNNVSHNAVKHPGRCLQCRMSPRNSHLRKLILSFCTLYDIVCVKLQKTEQMGNNLRPNEFKKSFRYPTLKNPVVLVCTQ